ATRVMVRVRPVISGLLVRPGRVANPACTPGAPPSRCGPGPVSQFAPHGRCDQRPCPWIVASPVPAPRGISHEGRDRNVGHTPTPDCDRTVTPGASVGPTVPTEGPESGWSGSGHRLDADYRVVVGNLRAGFAVGRTRRDQHVA